MPFQSANRPTLDRLFLFVFRFRNLELGANGWFVPFLWRCNTWGTAVRDQAKNRSSQRSHRNGRTTIIARTHFQKSPFRRDWWIRWLPQLGQLIVEPPPSRAYRNGVALHFIDPGKPVQIRLSRAATGSFELEPELVHGSGGRAADQTVLPVQSGHLNL